MKLISFLLIFFALVWSWSYIHSDNAIALESHQAIERQIAEILVQKIQTARPNASQIEIESIWSEVLDPKQVRVHFSYRLLDEQGAQVLVQGQGLVKKVLESPTEEKWQFKDIRSEENAILFEDMEIIAGKEEEAVNSESPTDETTPADAPPGSNQNSPPQTQEPADQ